MERKPVVARSAARDGKRPAEAPTGSDFAIVLTKAITRSESLPESQPWHKP